jgi:uncharacterized membrane-anchored protein
MSWTRRLLILGGLLLVLGVANAAILQKQRIADSARLILLELRPIDPRSLMQGDYMSLAFADTVALPPQGADLPEDGIAIVALDGNGVASFVRLDDGAPLAANEARLRFTGRTPDGRLDYGTDAFFFQEGAAPLYAEARYGMFRVDDTGHSVLVGLADETGEEIPGLTE